MLDITIGGWNIADSAAVCYDKNMATHKIKTRIKDLESVLEKTSDFIASQNFPPGFSQFLLYTLSELSANIKEHAQAKTATIGLEVKNNQCAIIITDDGQGLLKNYLTKKIRPKDDVAAIELALNGLSTKSATERGYGLSSTRKLVALLKGKLEIKTGTGIVAIEGNASRFKVVKKIPGLVIKITVPIKPINIYKALD